MRRLHPLLLLLAIAGCESSASSVSTRTITEVSWDANHQRVVSTHIVPLGGGSGSGNGGGVSVPSSPDLSVSWVDSSCKQSDFIISDAPLIRNSASVPELDPTSNLLCIKSEGTPSLIDISILAHPGGGFWPGNVRAFTSSTQPGALMVSDSNNNTTCQDNFHYYETSNASACALASNFVRLDVAGTVVTTCTTGSATCTGNALNVCDQAGEWQTQACGAGLTCSPQSLSCCVAPTCSPGTINQACGSQTNACTTVDCGCEGNLTCIGGKCRFIHVPTPPIPH